ncbi:MAG TPA: hypothetical protein VNI57_01455 [Candidatus Saccharimonadales bacterium]|nr:hypothetical protein [Candidatus Saccharimonadales bacterium]
MLRLFHGDSAQDPLTAQPIITTALPSFQDGASIAFSLDGVGFTLGGRAPVDARLLEADGSEVPTALAPAFSSVTDTGMDVNLHPTGTVPDGDYCLDIEWDDGAHAQTNLTVGFDVALSIGFGFSLGKGVAIARAPSVIGAGFAPSMLKHVSRAAQIGVGYAPLNPEVLYADDFNSLTAGADLGGQGGYTREDTGGAANLWRFLVNNAPTAEMTYQAGTPTGFAAWWRAFGTGKAFGGRVVTLETNVYVSSVGSGSGSTGIELLKGDLDISGFLTDALDFTVQRWSAGKVAVAIYDQDHPSSPAVSADLFDQDVTMPLRLVVRPNGTFDAQYKPVNAWVTFYTGTLFSGNENVDGLAWFSAVGVPTNGHVWGNMTVTAMTPRVAKKVKKQLVLGAGFGVGASSVVNP